MRADGLQRADGGRLIVYGTEAAAVAGRLSVRGGEQSGKAGFVATSAGYLEVNQAPDIGAAFGSGGSWRIDASALRIDLTGNQVISAGAFTLPAGFSAASATSVLGQDLIRTALQSGDVVVAAGNAANQTGNVAIRSPLAWNANRLTISALNNINLDADLIASGTGSLSLHYGQAVPDGGSFTYRVSPEARIEVPLSQDGFLWKKGSQAPEYPVVFDNGLLGKLWITRPIHATMAL
jgi:hypothetical protein